MDNFYLHIGNAKDLKTTRDRFLYRVLEIFPGFLIWGTFGLIIGFSFYYPFGVVIFIVLFDLYWLMKTVFLTWHLRQSFRVMIKNMQQDWNKALDEVDFSSTALKIKDWRKEIWHLVILPYYKEGPEILRNTLEALAKAEYPKERIMVVLSGEERAGPEAFSMGESIAKEFEHYFGKFYFTIHRDSPGELAGKGANETWAGRKAKENLIDPAGIPYENVIVSVFDVDTVVSAPYFAKLTHAYLTSANPLRTSFQPVPLFINNIWEAPALARVMAFSSTFWHLMNQMRPEQLISFSSHAFPFKALVEMDFWQVNVVSEDSRIFWQGLLRFDGDWRSEPLLIPVSMDANVAENSWKTLKNIYLQQRRWAYGVADFPYQVFGFIKNEKIPLRTKLYWTFHRIEGWWSWPTNSLLIFVMGWMPALLGGNVFGTSVAAYNIPRFSQWIMSLAMLGIVTSIYLTVKILPPRPLNLGRHRYIFMILQWLMVPVTLIFSSFPAIEAETRLMLGKYLGFWPTPKIRKGIQKVIFDSTKPW